MATVTAKATTGTNIQRCFNRSIINPPSKTKPTNAPLEYVNKIAGIVIRKRKPHNTLTQRLFSVCARKKNNGKVIFSARPKSLLSAIIEFAGPYKRKAPPVRIIKGNDLSTNKPKHPATTSTSILSRAKEFTMAIVTPVISSTLDTNRH